MTDRHPASARRRSIKHGCVLALLVLAFLAGRAILATGATLPSREHSSVNASARVDDRTEVVGARLNDSGDELSAQDDGAGDVVAEAVSLWPPPCATRSFAPHASGDSRVVYPSIASPRGPPPAFPS
jgi:hypothetical protein